MINHHINCYSKNLLVIEPTVFFGYLSNLNQPREDNYLTEKRENFFEIMTLIGLFLFLDMIKHLG